MQIKFIQYYTSNCTYAPAAEQINRLYCSKYNIEYYSLTDDNHIKSNNENRALQWYKIKFTKEILQSSNHDYIIFADADAVFVNHNKDIRDIINQYPSKELIISNDFGPDIVNTGVMIFKNTPWSINFLERIWTSGTSIARGNYLNGIWHEQTIISTHMITNPDDRNRTQITDTNGTDSINDVQHRQSTFIHHDISKSNFINIYNNIQSQHTNKSIGVVYHCFLTGNWKNIVSEQLSRLHQSGLYDAADIIWVTVNLNNESEESFRNVASQYSKINIEFHTTNHFEYPGIKKVKYIGDTYDNMKILYFHTKGVSNFYKDNATKQPCEEKINNMRACLEYLEYFVIDRWKDCLEKLNEYDNVGPDCNNNRLGGNFWWSQSKHIKRCMPVGIWGRWDYEGWHANVPGPVKNYGWFPAKINQYISQCDPDWYRADSNFIPDKIILHKATYGTSPFELDEGYRNYPLNVTTDVTSIVENSLKQYNNKQFSILVNNGTMGGDPSYGHIKFLMIEFSFANQPDKIHKIGNTEGQVLDISFYKDIVIDNSKKLFIISSSINTKYGQYDINTRFQQTLNTIKSVKDKAPGCKILIFELSIDKLNQDQINQLNVDYYIDDLGIPDLNEVYNIGAEGIVKNISEVYAMNKLLVYMKENDFHNKFIRIFKLSGRYELSDNFNMQVYDNLDECYTFNAIHSHKYYNTRLYSFSTSLLDHYIETFKNVLVDINNMRYNGAYMDIEHSLYKNLDPNLCVVLPYVGVTGYQASNAGLINE
jgi:hypothetical protein